MAKIARVVDTFVEEVHSEHPGGHSFEETFPPETLALFVTCPDEVEIGWSFDGSTWTDVEVMNPMLNRMIARSEQFKPETFKDVMAEILAKQKNDAPGE